MNVEALILTLIPIAIVLIIGIALPLIFRRVVEPNEVHIVQARKRTQSYGKDKEAGNAYYAWPHWVPVIGVQVVVLPISVFDVRLDRYEAYDIGKVPFVVDVVAFFRINSSNLAAERVSDFRELPVQLENILQGATRSILAKSEVEDIMQERSRYGEMFTEEVEKHIAEWGVTNVKSIEFMDIRDPADGASNTIRDIQARKQSLVERTSRVEVAENMRAAETAEIAAKRDVDLQDQQAREVVGQRTAEANKQIGIADEQANQEILTQQRETSERDMSVKRVQDVRSAEIERDQQIVVAEQERETLAIKAEGVKRETVTKAEGDKEAEQLRGDGIYAVGTKEADVLREKELAPVQAQIVLAQEIGENQGYQNYLIEIRSQERMQVVGVEQAEALQQADIRVITNAGAPAPGLDSVMEAFTPQGGAKIGAAIETFAQTPTGEQVLGRLGIKRDSDEAA